MEEGKQSGERWRKRRMRIGDAEKTVKPDTVAIRLDDREGREKRSNPTDILVNARYKSGEDLATDCQETATAKRGGDRSE